MSSSPVSDPISPNSASSSKGGRRHSRKNKMSRKNNRMTMHPGCCEATFHGLNKWYEMEFEKLGWMVLAKSRGHTDKITAYMNS